MRDAVLDWFLDMFDRLSFDDKVEFLDNLLLLMDWLNKHSKECDE